MQISPQRRDRRARRGRQFRLESLESRALLATTAETFNGPSLSDLIQQAQDGQDTAPAAISRMEKALQTQLTRGPLADLKSGAVDGNGFVSEVQSLESSYEQNLDQQLSSEFPDVDEILKLQGQQVVANVIALNQQSAVGLISSTDFASDAKSAINSLTSGPINALDTPLSGYTSTTQDLVSDIAYLDQSLSSTASPSLTPAQAMAAAIATTQAYQADIHAGLQVLHPHASRAVDAAVSTLESAETGIAQDDASTAAVAADIGTGYLRCGGARHRRGIRVERPRQRGDGVRRLPAEPHDSAGRLDDEQRLRHGDPGWDGHTDGHAHLARLRPGHRGCDGELHAGWGLRRGRGDR